MILVTNLGSVDPTIKGNYSKWKGWRHSSGLNNTKLLI